MVSSETMFFFHLLGQEKKQVNSGLLFLFAHTDRNTTFFKWTTPHMTLCHPIKAESWFSKECAFYKPSVRNEMFQPMYLYKEQHWLDLFGSWFWFSFGICEWGSILIWRLEWWKKIHQGKRGRHDWERRWAWYTTHLILVGKENLNRIQWRRSLDENRRRFTAIDSKQIEKGMNKKDERQDGRGDVLR